jgi:hypothetical protein
MTLTEFLLQRIAEDEARCGPADADGLRFCDADEGDHYRAARVLAECEAKRRIIAWYGDGGDVGDGGEFLSILALPYADHPDYRAEWRS